VSGKWDGIPTLPMFQLEPVNRERQKSPRTAAKGNCPGCRAANPVGLIRTEHHLVWRQHFYNTWGGSKQECPASNAAVCNARERYPFVNVDAVRCPCQGEQQ
jgi:hypothetical protein